MILVAPNIAPKTGSPGSVGPRSLGVLGVALGLLATLVAASASAAPSIPSIQVSIASGIAPLSVHFDATGTTDPAFPRPFHSLDYEWSFGDAASGAWTHSGRSKNQASGAIAGHLYANPGTYQVILTVTNPNGDESTATTTVTVTDPSTVFSDAATYCYADHSDHPENWSGCPRPCPSANCVNATNVNTALSGRLDPGTRHYFRRGDTFTQSDTVFIPGGGSPVLISSFGTGSKPVFSSNFGIETDQAFAPSSDWRVGGLTLSGTRGVPLGNNGGGLTRLTYWDIDVTGFNQCAVFSGQGHSLFGIYDVSCTALTPSVASGIWLVFDHSARANYQGIRVDGAGATNANGVFRTVGMSRSVVSNNFLHAADTQGVLSLRSCGAGTQPGCTSGMPNRFIIVSDNRLVSSNAVTLRTCTVNTCADTGSNGNESVDFVWERNFITVDAAPPPAPGIVFVWWIQGGDQTFRNNVVDVTGAPAEGALRILIEQRGPTSPGGANRNNLHFLNNTIFSNSAISDLIACGMTASNGTGHLCRNNLIYAPLAGTKTSSEDADWTASDNLRDGSEYAGFPFATGYAGQGVSKLGDFQLSAASPAVDAGFSFAGPGPATVARDAFLGCRPAGAGWDVGADEYGALACGTEAAAPSAPVLLP